MGGFDGLRFQCIAQGVRHGLRIAKIAHESTSSSANGRNRGLPCRPARQWRGPWKEIDTFTIPERVQAAGVSTLSPDLGISGAVVNRVKKARRFCTLTTRSKFGGVRGIVGGESVPYRKIVQWRATADEDGHYCFAVAL